MKHPLRKCVLFVGLGHKIQNGNGECVKEKQPAQIKCTKQLEATNGSLTEKYRTKIVAFEFRES